MGLVYTCNPSYSEAGGGVCVCVYVWEDCMCVPMHLLMHVTQSSIDLRLILSDQVSPCSHRLSCSCSAGVVSALCPSPAPKPTICRAPTTSSLATEQLPRLLPLFLRPHTP